MSNQWYELVGLGKQLQTNRFISLISCFFWQNLSINIEDCESSM